MVVQVEDQLNHLKTRQDPAETSGLFSPGNHSRVASGIHWCHTHTLTHTRSGTVYVFAHCLCCSCSGLWFADGLPCHNDMRFVRRRCIQVSHTLTHRCSDSCASVTWSCKCSDWLCAKLSLFMCLFVASHHPTVFREERTSPFSAGQL